MHLSFSSASTVQCEKRGALPRLKDERAEASRDREVCLRSWVRPAVQPGFRLRAPLQHPPFPCGRLLSSICSTSAVLAWERAAHTWATGYTRALGFEGRETPQAWPVFFALIRQGSGSHSPWRVCPLNQSAPSSVMTGILARCSPFAGSWTQASESLRPGSNP